MSACLSTTLGSASSDNRIFAGDQAQSHWGYAEWDVWSGSEDTGDFSPCDAFVTGAVLEGLRQGPRPMPKNILVVEDDRDIGRLLDLHLRDMGYFVKVVPDGSQGLHEAVTRSYDLVILDVMLPGLDGLELCRRMRADSDAYTPILMLTAKSSEVDRVLGLEVGADDYLTKPFSIRELLARVKAVFRRVEACAAGAPIRRAETLRAGAVHIDVEKRSVTVGGSQRDLTAKEFDLLLHFAKNPGRVFTRAQLLDAVWGYGHDGYEHTVNSHSDLAPLNGSRSYGRVWPKGGPYATFASHRRTNSCQAA